MGTAEQKERRRKYIEDSQNIFEGASRGDWATDDQLKNYLRSLGLNPDKALFNQFYSGGGYSTYGSAWDPGKKNDFNTDEEIMHMGPGETWYDPSVSGNWQKTDPLKARRMAGHFGWRDENGEMIDNRFGGNAFAASQRLKALSNRPGVNDMSWWNEGNGAANGINNIGNAGTGLPDPSVNPTAFWDWFYTNPGQNINQFSGSLSGVPGFDANRWDKFFNPISIPDKRPGLPTAQPPIPSGIPASKLLPTYKPPIDLNAAAVTPVPGMSSYLGTPRTADSVASRGLYPRAQPAQPAERFDAPAAPGMPPWEVAQQRPQGRMRPYLY